jgi:hypothetical protein
MLKGQYLTTFFAAFFKVRITLWHFTTEVFGSRLAECIDVCLPSVLPCRKRLWGCIPIEWALSNFQYITSNVRFFNSKQNSRKSSIENKIKRNVIFYITITDQPRGLVVRVSDYWSWGPEFDSRLYYGNFSLKGKIPMVTMVWVELTLRPLLVPHIHVSPSTSSGQRNCASWASQLQKSVTLRPQPGGDTTKSIRDMWWLWKKNFTLTIALKVFSKILKRGNKVF